MKPLQNIEERIKQRRRQLLLHSYGYYCLGETSVSDEVFDRWAYELVQLQNDYPTEASQVEYSKEFEGFDGSTGYDLPWNKVLWVKDKWHKYCSKCAKFNIK